MFAMHVRHEVFRALGQVEDCLQVDDFRAGALYVGEAARENLQQTKVTFHLLFGYIMLCNHFLLMMFYVDI